MREFGHIETEIVQDCYGYSTASSDFFHSGVRGLLKGCRFYEINFVGGVGIGAHFCDDPGPTRYPPPYRLKKYHAASGPGNPTGKVPGLAA